MRAAPRRSLLRRTLFYTACGLGAVILLATLFGYWNVSRSLRIQALEQLEIYVEERGRRDSGLFLLAQDDLRELARAWDKELSLDRGSEDGGSDVRVQFDPLFERYADGTHRLHAEHFERYGITGIIRKHAEIDDDLRARMRIGHRLLRQYGPAWRSRFANLYLAFSYNAVLMYWPENPWGLDAASWEIGAKSIADTTGVDSPGEGPSPPVQWSNLYFDYGAGEWTLSAALALGDAAKGDLVAVDIPLTTLVERTLTEGLEGTFNLIVRDNGDLIAHPHYMDAILANGGDLSLDAVKDPELTRLYARLKQYWRDTAIVDHPEKAQYLAVARLSGPPWYLVTVFPYALINDQAVATAEQILLLYGTALTVGLLLMYAVLKRLIARPLTQLTRATVQLAEGDLSARVAVTAHDEAGQLAAAFNAMASRLQEALVSRDRLREAQEKLRHAKDAAEAANRAKSTFLANMSHELRTPLNAILGFTRLTLRDSGLTPAEARENLVLVQRSGEHLLELINDVLEMSKIEAGRAELQESPFDLHELLDTMVHLFLPRSEEKGVALHLDMGSDLPRHIMADERKLRQILLNLLGNAVKFTSEGGILLRAGCKPIDGGYRLEFAVTDTGSGISDDELDRLFEPFVQSKEASVGEREGSGLGLAISRQFARLMGGDIDVESHPGRGSCFRFSVRSVPAQAGQPEQAARGRGRVIGLLPGQRAYRILIVEDKEANRLLLRKLMTSAGFEVREAEDGRRGLEVFQQWAPDLIWMDMRMPIMDGYEATRQIKSSDRGRATSVIALTASAFDEQRSLVLSAGCDDFIRKPFREEEVFHKMAQHLGIRFRYESDATHPAEDPGTVTIDASEFVDVPRDLLAAMHAAASQADGERLMESVAAIRAIHEDLAVRLEELVENFRYDHLLETIQAAIDTRDREASSP